MTRARLAEVGYRIRMSPVGDRAFQRALALTARDAIEHERLGLEDGEWQPLSAR
jgi:hypothetical protein